MVGKVLHLTLKKKWFDKVGNDKPEEYRHVCEWSVSRLIEMHKELKMPGFVGWSKVHAFHYSCGLKGNEIDAVDFLLEHHAEFAAYDLVTFHHGYKKNAPTKTFKFEGTKIDYGFEEWGAEPGKKYFVIKLGEKL